MASRPVREHRPVSIMNEHSTRVSPEHFCQRHFLRRRGTTRHVPTSSSCVRVLPCRLRLTPQFSGRTPPCDARRERIMKWRARAVAATPCHGPLQLLVRRLARGSFAKHDLRGGTTHCNRLPQCRHWFVYGIPIETNHPSFNAKGFLQTGQRHAYDTTALSAAIAKQATTPALI